MFAPDANWTRLHNGETYKVYDNPDGLLDRLICRYTITSPDGTILGTTATRRGARRVIAKHKQRRQAEQKWWDAPVVDEVTR